MSSDIEMSSFADFDKIKGTYTNLYFIAASVMGDYILNPNQKSERIARESLLNLYLPLYTKVYILKDNEASSYLAYFNINPHLFSTMAHLETVWLILQRLISRLGLDRIEQAQIPKHKAYMEEN